MFYPKIISLLLVFSFIIGNLCAQTSVKPEKLYDNLAYREAINFYESKDELNLEDMTKIANGYRLNHDTENAALWYEQVVAQSDDPIHHLHFAQALQSNGSYEMAKKYFLLYNQMIGNHSSDQRGTQLAAAIDRMNDWKNETDVVLKEEKTINSPNLDFSPTYYKDGIVFVSSRKLLSDQKDKWTGDHFMNLYYATQNDEGELEEVASFSKIINSKYHEGPVAFNKSYNKIFFTRNDHVKGKIRANKKGVMKLGIFTAMNNGDQWTTPKPLNFNTKEHEECHPTLSADGTHLYFASDRPGGEGGMDIYVAKFKGGKWGEPRNLGPNINTPGNDAFPNIHDDGTLYFASDGWGGLGGLDIFQSNKDEENQWKKAENMGQPYNSRKDDFGFVMNILGTEGYFNSSRDGGSGKDDIYSFNRNIESVDQVEKILKSGNKENGNITIYNFINNKFSADNPKEVKDAIKSVQANVAVSKSKKSIIINAPDKVVEPPLPLPIEPIIPQPILNEPKIASTGQNTIIPITESEKIEANSKAPYETFEAKKEIKVGEVFVLKNVYYEYNEHIPLVEGYKELDRVVKFLKEKPEVSIELSSHTDARGRTRYNTYLSRKRAESAKAYLLKKGISSERIKAKGYGETMLINKCADGVKCDESKHQLNRRTEIKILKL